MPWQIRSVRVSVFPPPAANGWQLPTWGSIIGGEPDNRVTPAPGLRVEEGPFGRGRLSVQGQQVLPLRADLMYVTGAPDPAVQQPPSLGTFDEAMLTVRPPAHQLIEHIGPVGRIALAVEHFEPTHNLDEALQVLSGRLDPRRFDLTNVQDFGYQINRPRPSRVVPNLRINRVAKWATVGWQLMPVNLQTGEVAAGGQTAVLAALQTDVNTDAGYEHALPGNALHGLLTELEQFTAELATAGDLP